MLEHGEANREEGGISVSPKEQQYLLEKFNSKQTELERLEAQRRQLLEEIKQAEERSSGEKLSLGEAHKLTHSETFYAERKENLERQLEEAAAQIAILEKNIEEMRNKLAA